MATIQFSPVRGTNVHAMELIRLPFTNRSQCGFVLNRTAVERVARRLGWRQPQLAGLAVNEGGESAGELAWLGHARAAQPRADLNTRMRMREITEASPANWRKLIDKASDGTGSLILYHGGPLGIEQLDTNRNVLCVGCYLTPSARYAGHYASRNAAVYTVRVTGRILDLTGTEREQKLAVRAEARRLAKERTDAFHEAPETDEMEFLARNQAERNLQADAFKQVYKKHGFVGDAIPEMGEVIVYDPAAMEIIAQKKRSPRRR